MKLAITRALVMTALILGGGRVSAANSGDAKDRVAKWDSRAYYLTAALQEVAARWDDGSKLAHGPIEDPLSLRAMIALADDALADVPKGVKNLDGLKDTVTQAKEMVRVDDLTHWKNMADADLRMLRATEKAWSLGRENAHGPADDEFSLRGAIKKAGDLLANVPAGADNADDLKSEVAHAQELVDAEDAAAKK